MGSSTIQRLGQRLSSQDSSHLLSGHWHSISEIPYATGLLCDDADADWCSTRTSHGDGRLEGSRNYGDLYLSGRNRHQRCDRRIKAVTGTGSNGPRCRTIQTEVIGTRKPPSDAAARLRLPRCPILRRPLQL